jgi:predicted RND superfamily exporter protein
MLSELDRALNRARCSQSPAIMHATNALRKLPEGLIRALISVSRASVRRPAVALLIAGLFVLAAAPGVWRLRLETDGRALISKDAPEFIYDRSVRDQFGVKDQLIVLVRTVSAGGDIFNPDTLRLVRELTAELQKLPGVAASDVMSLATEPSFRFRPGTSSPQTLLEPSLQTKPELAQLRDDLARIALYNGTLVSADSKSTVILVGVPNGAERSQFYWTVRRIADAGCTARDQVAVTGSPAAESLLGNQLLEDLGVPVALLGGGLRGGAKANQSWPPRSFHGLKLLIARPAGLVPVAALVMMLTFYLCFGRAMAAVLPLPGVLATLLFVFGVMGWLGAPVYLTTAVMPVLLTVMSVTNDIYIFNRYIILLREKPGINHVDLLDEAMEKLVRPVAVTSLTAVIGFLSFGFSPVIPVRAFGIFTAAGALFGLCLSLTVLPALLALTKPGWLLSLRRAAPEPAAGSFLGAWFARAGQAVVRRRWWVAGFAVVVGLITSLGLRGLKVQDSWTGGFAVESEFRQVTRLVNEQFFGMHMLLVSVDAPMTLSGEFPAAAVTRQILSFPGELVRARALLVGSPVTVSVGGSSETGASADVFTWHSHIEAAARRGNHLQAWTGRDEPGSNFWQALGTARRARFEITARSQFRPEVIRAIGGLGSFIRERRQYAVGGVLGPMDYLMTTRFMVHPTSPDARVISDDAGEVKTLWDYYGSVLGQQRLRQLVDTNFWRSLITVFLKDANFEDTAKLMKEIRDYERERLTPAGIKLGFAGDVAVSQSLIRSIVSTQMQSLLWSLAGIFVVTAWFGGSLRWGLYCLLPSFLAVLIKFAIMGCLGIPLGVATSMFAAMTLGIGVNCAIHLLEGCAQARASGASPAEAMARSLRLTGPPALINTLAMSLGFGVLLLSQVPANARLGTLVVLGLVNCFVMSLLVLPLLFHWWPLKPSRS